MRRILSYDVARSLAIVCVVLCHTLDIIFPEPGVISNFVLRIVVLILWIIGRMGVPLFLCLSGALLLKKGFNTHNDIKNFYKKNLLLLLLVYFAWIIIYNIFLIIMDPVHGFSPLDILSEMVFLKQVPLMNMWYLPMILGIYLFIPLLSKLVRSFSLRSLLLPIIVMFISFCVLPTINILFIRDNNHPPINTLLDLSFLGGLYGLYIILGYYISKYKKKLKLRSLALIGGLSFIMAVITQLITLFIAPDQHFQLWYNQPFLFIGSLCLFALIIRYNFTSIPQTFKSSVTTISKLSLGIFFVHVIFLGIIDSYIIDWPIMSLLKVLLLFIISFSGSIVVVYLVSRNKQLAKYLFYIKS